MKVKKKVVLSSVVSLSVFLLFSPLAFGQSVSSAELVNATVKVSVCGDRVAEGVEECDNSDLNEAVCADLGYSEGVLSCDAACDFITSGCSGVADTTSVESANSTSTSTTSVVSSVPVVSSPITFIPPTALPVLGIPKALNRFDLDNSGKIEVVEMSNAVKSWMDGWIDVLAGEVFEATGETFGGGDVEKCDVNDDDVCNLIDLSVLLFYIEYR